MGLTVLGHQLEASPSTAGQRIPPSLLDRPGPGPGRDPARRTGLAVVADGEERGSALTVPRPLTATVWPRSSTTLAGTSAAGTRAGDGGGNRPGQGPDCAGGAERPSRSSSSTDAAGTVVTCSPGPRPPRHSGARTASGPRETGQPGGGSRRPLGPQAVPTPEPELAALVGHHLHGEQGQGRDAGRGAGG